MANLKADNASFTQMVNIEKAFIDAQLELNTLVRTLQTDNPDESFECDVKFSRRGDTLVVEGSIAKETGKTSGKGKRRNFANCKLEYHGIPDNLSQQCVDIFEKHLKPVM